MKFKKNRLQETDNIEPLPIFKAISLKDFYLLRKQMFILELLYMLKNASDTFPENPGRVIIHEGAKFISKEEILFWQHANDGGMEERRMTGDEFDDIIQQMPFVLYLGPNEDNLTYYRPLF